MKRKIFFCKSWFAAKRKPTEVWSEEKARQAHELGQPYTILVDSITSPFCTIDITNKFAGVDFLDVFLRESVTYQFQEVEQGKLFLTMATHREFDGDTDQVVSGTTYMFDRDGGVRIRRETFVPEYKLETSASEVDVASNYSETPSFGEYDDLIRLER